ncbi:AAA family ATPase [Solihabitans fulvus]|uniref:AAA family ATPase n=1 Tax=Solihabitans fulvus TaxID=1892852 RepID=A0A5B2XM15_9PSEU|nr:MinD/ParA family protein [Solihabitans fulvus]KAA2264827.1 AAA family ATPase [Solihabitans fulvus]
MTGRYEDPEPRHTVSWQPPSSAEGQSHPSAEPATVYIEPVGSGPIPVADGSQVSGGPSGAYPVSGGPSGPYPVSGGPSGPYPVSGGSSGPHQVGGGQSGAYQVGGGQSGAYQVGGGQSGAYYVDPATSGAYPPSAYPPPSPPQSQQPQHQQPQHQQVQQPHFAQHAARPGSGSAHEVSSQRLIKQEKRAPQSGWRRTLHTITGGLVNLGESPADLRRRELITRINQPLRGCYKIAMLSLKGGVGKTTTTTTLGSTFSSLRGDRVVAVDANPDRGTLSMKIPRETTATVRHLLRDAKRITRYSDVRAYTSQGPSRLEVLASEQDPAVSEAFSDEDYQRTVTLLEHFYNIVLTDCGTGLMHSAMRGVLESADSLVIVSSGSVDGAQSAAATLDWLDAHGYRDLVAKSVAVINSVRPGSGKVDLDKLAAHFGARCRAVCRIPFDPHLEEGAEIELDKLGPDTRLALLELAATVADDFPN